MPRPAREPFAVSTEPDGSLRIAVFPYSSRGREAAFHHLGHVKASPNGGFIFSPFYEENENLYEEWSSCPDLEGAVMSLIRPGTEADLCDDPARVADMKVAEALGPSYIHRVRDGLVMSAKAALVEAVRNMLLVASHDDVMTSVSEALVSSVMDG